VLYHAFNDEGNQLHHLQLVLVRPPVQHDTFRRRFMSQVGFCVRT